MSAFELDDEPLSVQRFSGFTLPDDIQTIGILGNGTSRYNQVIQSPGTGLRTAQLSGRTSDAAEIARLEALRDSEEPVSFLEPRATHRVVVNAFRPDASASAYFLWDWSMALVELPPDGS